MGNYRGFRSPHASFIGDGFCIYQHANGRSLRRRFRWFGCRFIPLRYPSSSRVSNLYIAVSNYFSLAYIWHNCMESWSYVINSHGNLSLFFMEERLAVDEKYALVFYRSNSLWHSISRMASCHRSGSIWIICALFLSAFLSVFAMV